MATTARWSSWQPEPAAMVNADHQGGGGGEQQQLRASHPFKLTGTPLKVAQAITAATGRETHKCLLFTTSPMGVINIVHLILGQVEIFFSQIQGGWCRIL